MILRETQVLPAKLVRSRREDVREKDDQSAWEPFTSK